MSPTTKFFFKLVAITVGYVVAHIYLNKASLQLIDVAVEQLEKEEITA